MDNIQIVALVATTGRASLFSRCLPSILNQARRPEKVLVVLDQTACPPLATSLPSSINSFLSPKIECDILFNKLSPGAAGTWNTALLSLLDSNLSSLSTTYVAILDDDDHWSPSHLSTVHQTILTSPNPPPLVYTGIVRIETSPMMLNEIRLSNQVSSTISEKNLFTSSQFIPPSSIQRKLTIPQPSKLKDDDFLAGNPHIQGSNVVFRLDAVHIIGLFDETLKSCTDRDLLIRFINADFLGRLQTTNQYTAYHHTEEEGVSRLSDRQSHSKMEGLSTFFEKYQLWMSADVRDRFLKRNKKLFGWEPSPSPAPAPAPSPSPSAFPSPTAFLPSPPSPSPSLPSLIKLLIGVCSDSNSTKIKPLLEDLASLSETPKVTQKNISPIDIDIIILENGPIKSNPSPLSGVVEWACSTLGLRITLISPERVEKDHGRGVFSSLDFNQLPSEQHRSPIAVSRTLVQQYLFSFWQNFANASGERSLKRKGVSVGAMIFDDDKRIPDPPSFGRALGEWLTHPPISAVFFPDRGSPPLPVLFSLRTQLFDLSHNLHSMLAFEEYHNNSPLPCSLLLSKSLSNQQFLEKCPELYHDISGLHTNHLERPFWFIDHTTPYQTPSAIIHELSKNAKLLCIGGTIVRPVVPSSSGLIRYGDGRGGACLITDPNLLTVPNTTPIFDGLCARRSDFMWAWLCRQMGAATTRPLSPSVSHERKSALSESNVSDMVEIKRDELMKQAVADILGSSVYRACVSREQMLGEGPKEENIEVFDIEKEGEVFVSECRDRFLRFFSSIYRIWGLALSLRSLLKRYHLSPSLSSDQNTLEEVVAWVERVCSPSWWLRFAQDFLGQLEAHHKDTFRKWRGNLPEIMKTSQPSCHLLTDIAKDLWVGHRCRSATHALLSSVPHIKDVHETQVIGIGGEGVTILHTPMNKVYKYLDLFTIRCSVEGKQFLYNLLWKEKEHHSQYSTLSLPLPPASVDFKYLVREFVKGCPHQIPQSSGPQMVQFIVECRKMGVVFTNVSPENFIVQMEDEEGNRKKGVRSFKFIDFGIDIVPWSQEEEIKMLLRLYLTWRWPHRKDLKQLLRKSLAESVWKTALNRPFEVENEIPELFGFADFLCAIAQRQEEVNGPESQECVLPSFPHKKKSDQSALKSKNTHILLDLVRQETSASPYSSSALPHLSVFCEGCFDVSILLSSGFSVTFGSDKQLGCDHPFNFLVCFDNNLDDLLCGWYNYCINVSDSNESCFFSSNQEMKSHGFQLKRIGATTAIDHKRFEPTIHHTFLLSKRTFSDAAYLPTPIPTTKPAHPCCLLIVACVMESGHIRQCLLHLSRQLCGSLFARRVLVVDSRKDSFLRKYAEGDEREFRSESAWLLQHNIIDDVIWASGESVEVQQRTKRWFRNRRCSSTHAQNGTPVDVVLMGFEYCLQFAPVVLRLDSDILIHMSPRTHFFQTDSPYFPSISSLKCTQIDSSLVKNWGAVPSIIPDALSFFASHPNALCLSLNIVNDPQAPAFPLSPLPPIFSPHHRVEARASFFHLNRLTQHLPLTLSDDVWPSSSTSPLVGWYRLLDNGLKSLGSFSYRGGDSSVSFLHPPNSLKRHLPTYALVMECVEQGRIPPQQRGKVDVVGYDWAEGGDGSDVVKKGDSVVTRVRSYQPLIWLNAMPRLNAPLIFVVCGKNVPLSRSMRCLQSLKVQDFILWQAVIVLDGSEEESYIDKMRLLSSEDPRIVLFRRRFRAGQLHNITDCVKYLCINPRSIIAVVDLDDSLIGSHVASYLVSIFEEKDLQIAMGGCLFCHKKSSFSPPIDLQSPRQKRSGGFVWSHLRAFRQQLFNRIPLHYLCDQEGNYFQDATDWSYMIPMIEMASRKFIISEKILYFYEASWWPSSSSPFDRREKAIEQIVSKTECVRRRYVVAVVGYGSWKTVPNSWRVEQIAEEVGFLLASSSFVVVTGGLGGVMEAAARGAKRAGIAQRKKRENDDNSLVIGILPNHDPTKANVYCDVVLPTASAALRNSIIGNCDGMVVVGGGAGTLSELSFAWSARRVIVALPETGGVAKSMAGKKIDNRRSEPIYSALNPQEAIDYLERNIGKDLRHPSLLGSKL